MANFTPSSGSGGTKGLVKRAGKKKKKSAEIVEAITRSTVRSAYDKDKNVPPLVMNRKLQLLMILYIVLPQLIAVYVLDLDPSPSALWARWTRSITTGWPAWLQSRELWLISFCMFVERACYTVVWTKSEYFLRVSKRMPLRLLGSRPTEVVYKLFLLNKIFQMGPQLAFLVLRGSNVSPLDWGKIPLYQWITGLQLILLGQFLNSAIYRAIGKKGVYYGVRLGEPVPYCTGFPFNVVTAHPQYLGCISTCIGCYVLWTTPQLEAAGSWGLVIMQILQYFYMGYVEECC